MGNRPIAALLAGALLTTGCSSAPTPQPAPSTSANLPALAAQYKLPACPTTDPTATQIDGGLPQTSLTCLDGTGSVNLAGLPREPMIINLWAQWCGPCRVESPFLREAQEIDGVTMLGINYDDPQPDWAIEFAGRVGWRYPQVADPDKSLRADLSVAGLPTTLFVDDAGVITGIHAGQLMSLAQLKDLTKQYLGVS